MPRKKFIPSDTLPYFVTARCRNRDWFAIPLDEVWDTFTDYFYLMHKMYDLRVINFVLMGNHYHAVVTTPQANLDVIMNYFQREVSRQIARRSDRINQIFGGPYHWSILDTKSYYLNAYKYCYRNPVEAGLCRTPLDYKYSTLPGLLGLRPLQFPLAEDTTLLSDVSGTLKWLNTGYPNQVIKKAVKDALMKHRFRFNKKLGFDAEVF